MSELDLMSLPRSLRRDLVSVKACYLYIEAAYQKYKTTGLPRIHITPFHTALMQGEIDFVRNVLREITNSEATLFFLNSVVTYTKSTKDRIPIHIEYLKEIKDKMNPGELHRLGWMARGYHINVMSKMLSHRDPVVFELCGAMSCVSGKEELLELLIEYGLQLNVRDTTGGNTLHSIVQLGISHPAKAVRLFHKVIKVAGHYSGQVEELLFTKNDKNKTALDLAAENGIPELIQYILNTSTYRHTVSVCSVYTHIRYDVTKYENETSEISKSIIYSLTDFSAEQLNRAQLCKLFTGEPLKTWIDAKFKQCRKYLIGIIVFWLIFVTLFFVQLTIYINHGEFSTFLAFVLFIFAAIILLIEICYMKTNCLEMCKYFTDLFISNRNPVTFTLGYRIFQLSFCSLLIISTAFMMSPSLSCSYPNVVNALYVLTSFSSLFSLLFFLQLSSTVGLLLILMQKMIYRTIIFLAMLGMVYIAFVLALFLLHNPPPTPKNCDNNISIPKNCTKAINQFYSLSSSFYVTYLLYLSAVAPTDIEFPCASLPGMAQILYMLLLLCFAVVLLNLLIAIMTKTTDDLSHLQSDILKLQRICIMLYVEDRLRTYVFKHILQLCSYVSIQSSKLTNSICTSCGSCRQKCSCCPDRHSSLAADQSLFYVDPETGKIYLEVIENVLEVDASAI